MVNRVIKLVAHAHGGSDHALVIPTGGPHTALCAGCKECQTCATDGAIVGRPRPILDARGTVLHIVRCAEAVIWLMCAAVGVCVAKLHPVLGFMDTHLPTALCVNHLG